VGDTGSGLRLADVLVPLIAGVAGGSYRNIGRGAQAALGAYDAVRTWRHQDEERHYQQKQRELEVENRERLGQYLRSRTAGLGDTTSREDAAQQSLDVPARVRENELVQEKGLISPELAGALQGARLNDVVSLVEQLGQKAAERQAMPATPQDAFAQFGQLPQGAEASMETRGGVKVQAQGEPFFRPNKPEEEEKPTAVHGYGVTKFVEPRSGRVVSETRVPVAPREPTGDEKSPAATLGNLLIRKMGKKSVKDLTPEEAGAVSDALLRAQMSPTDQFFSELMAKRKGGGAGPTGPVAGDAKPQAPNAKRKPRTAEELLGQ
jgi:hypothetical protein